MVYLCTLGSRLSIQLHKYYTHRGNRLLFSNGMSLNQLALAMWEKLGYKSMDASILSKVINGERLFTINQLNVFTEVLDIHGEEKYALTNIILDEQTNRYGADFHDFLTRETAIILTEDSLNKIKRLRFAGQSPMAVEWTEQIVEKFDEWNSGSTLPNRVYDNIAEIILEGITALIEIENPSRIFKSVSPLISKINNLSHISNKDRINSLVSSRIGDMHYIVGENRQNHKYLEKSINYLSKSLNSLSSSEEKLYPLRVLAFSCALLDKEREFKECKKLLLEVIADSSCEAKCMAYAKIVGSEVKLGLYSDAEKSLSKAWNEFAKISRAGDRGAILSRLQLTAAEIRLINSLYPGKKKNYIEKIGTEAVSIASALGYIRNTARISSLLNESLS